MFPLNASLCLPASAVAMANPAMTTVPEVRYEESTGEQLANDLAEISGRRVTDIQNESVHVTLIMMNAAGELPFDRPDLLRLARRDSFVRPIELAKSDCREWWQVTCGRWRDCHLCSTGITDEQSDD